MKSPFNNKRYERLENTEAPEKKVEKKKSFIDIFSKDSKNISKENINEINLLLEKGIHAQDFNALVTKVRPIRMWVRENKEHLINIGSSIDAFEEIAENAKKCKEDVQPLINMQWYEGPVVTNAVKQYMKHAREEMKIAHKLYDHIHQGSSSS